MQNQSGILLIYVLSYLRAIPDKLNPSVYWARDLQGSVYIGREETIPFFLLLSVGVIH